MDARTGQLPSPAIAFAIGRPVNSTGVSRNASPNTSWNLFRITAALIIRCWLKVFHQLTIEGVENLPVSGSFILVSNHCSHLDALCLQSVFPVSRLNKIYAAASAKYFLMIWYRWIAAVAVANALPIHPLMHLRESIRSIRDLLDTPGRILILFPEGTRSTSGVVGRFRPGIGALVAGTSLPVVPCSIRGTAKALGKGHWFPRPCKLSLRIGPPRTYHATANNRDGQQSVAQDLQQAVCQLTRRIDHNDPKDIPSPTFAPAPAAAPLSGNKS